MSESAFTDAPGLADTFDLSDSATGVPLID